MISYENSYLALNFMSRSLVVQTHNFVIVNFEGSRVMHIANYIYCTLKVRYILSQ